MKQPVSRTAEGIKLHEAGDFEGMRRAGALAARTLDMIAPHVRHGVSTNALDRLCCAFIRHHGAEPAPLGYRGYPKSICTSINHVVCHGIPGERRLRRAGATAVIQPGGAIRDDAIVMEADRRNLAMVFTNLRHFRH